MKKLSSATYGFVKLVFTADLLVLAPCSLLTLLVAEIDVPACGASQFAFHPAVCALLEQIVIR